MWFKNVRLLQFQKPITSKLEQLSQQLAELAFKPCPKSLPSSYGWVTPLDADEAPLCYADQGCILIRLRIEEKVLPPSVLREHLTAEIKLFEQKAERRIYKDEKERLKDDVYQTLLSKAFSKSSFINGCIDTKHQRLLVDCASAKKTAHFVSLLNKCLNNLAFTPKLNSITDIMTQWLLTNDYPTTFALTNACLMKSLEENGSIVRIKNEDLLSDKVLTFLKDGNHVTQLSLEWNHQLRFTLKEDFLFSGIKFLETVKELARDGMSETKEERFASDFIIMTQTLQKFLEDVLPAFIPEENKILATV
ncbi:MAG: hypothetical protein A3F41_00545 [Coxiella sp. RIFCSPHIGHO2_12_FULL_44_14]|nr:MAG: hypothetical protein A3F41_00545 [Coxiella sp. RIFCSPHIGHO2_12_FULL_44_14]